MECSRHIAVSIVFAQPRLSFLFGIDHTRDLGGNDSESFKQRTVRNTFVSVLVDQLFKKINHLGFSVGTNTIIKLLFMDFTLF